MTEMKACLVRPHQRYQDSYIDGVWEYIREKQSVTWHPEILRTRFAEYLQVLQQAETDPLAGMVPSSRYWLIGDGQRYLGGCRSAASSQ